jgi:hypothetical protein
LSPRALVMWLVIMTPAVSASQSPNISQTQSKQCADGNILDAPAAGAPTPNAKAAPLTALTALGIGQTMFVLRLVTKQQYFQMPTFKARRSWRAFLCAATLHSASPQPQRQPLAA